MSLRFLPINFNAILVELDDLEQTMALVAALHTDPIPGIMEMVPAARTVMVTFDPCAVTAAALVSGIGSRKLDAWSPDTSVRIEIPVTYTGEDLDDVARALGMSSAEVVRRHTGSDYVAAFLGFAPGFAYLTGGDPVLNLPRRTVPRTRVPAGAVAIAGPFSGVYPQASPGGWQILGTTSMPMWDLTRDSPALLRVGDRVRFVDSPGHAVSRSATKTDESRSSAALPSDRSTLAFKGMGPQALLQDQGRTGRAWQGVSASGAMDMRSLRAANRRVGNAAGEACIEMAYGGYRLACRGTAVVAVVGAQGALTLRRRSGAERPVARDDVLALDEGDELFVGEPTAGVRSYLAVRGGFDVTPVLGSLSTDTLANIGPRPLAVGDVLPIRQCGRGAIVEPSTPGTQGWPTAGSLVELDVVLGPRVDWFTTESVARLCGQEWQVTPQSNRVGVRLHGELPLLRAIQGELPSEGTAIGAIQVPPSGQPVVFLADHPLTGGYPVIASIALHHLDRAGQIPINARIQFKVVRGPDLSIT